MGHEEAAVAFRNRAKDHKNKMRIVSITRYGNVATSTLKMEESVFSKRLVPTCEARLCNPEDYRFQNFNCRHSCRKDQVYLQLYTFLITHTYMFWWKHVGVESKERL